MGLGRGLVEISQTRFPQAHTLHRFNNTETTLTSTAPEAVQTTGSTSPVKSQVKMLGASGTAANAGLWTKTAAVLGRQIIRLHPGRFPG